MALKYSTKTNAQKTMLEISNVFLNSYFRLYAFVVSCVGVCVFFFSVIFFFCYKEIEPIYDVGMGFKRFGLG